MEEEKSFIDPKYIVECSCGTIFVNYFTRGRQRTKCDSCLKEKENSRQNRYNSKARKEIACKVCGEKRMVSYRYYNHLANNKEGNICRSCSMTKNKKSPTKKRKKRKDKTQEISVLAKRIKEKESKLKKVDVDANHLKSKDTFSDDMKKMQEEWLKKNKATKIEPAEINPYSTGLKIDI